MRQREMQRDGVLEQCARVEFVAGAWGERCADAAEETSF